MKSHLCSIVWVNNRQAGTVQAQPHFHSKFDPPTNMIYQQDHQPCIPWNLISIYYFCLSFVFILFFWGGCTINSTNKKIIFRTKEQERCLASLLSCFFAFLLLLFLAFSAKHLSFPFLLLRFNYSFLLIVCFLGFSCLCPYLSCFSVFWMLFLVEATFSYLLCNFANFTIFTLTWTFYCLLNISVIWLLIIRRS